MILFSFPAYASLEDALVRSLNIGSGQFSVDRFPNQELHSCTQTDVVNQLCVILGSISPPDEQLLSLLLLSHTLKKEKANTVTIVLPYLAYSRGERKEVGKSLTTAWVGALLQASGVDEAVTVDVHSPEAQHLFPVPLVSLSPATLFAQEMERASLLDATLVAPDEGARERCQAVAQAARTQKEIVFLQKRRTPQGVSHWNISGSVGKRVVIVDDILDTGGTLVSCCQYLRQLGTQEIVIMVTHGLFTGTSWQQLWTLGVKRVYCTDTLPQAKEMASERISVVPVGSLLDAFLKALL